MNRIALFFQCIIWVNIEDAINFFGGNRGSNAKLADAVGASKQYVSDWKATGGYLPPLYAHRFNKFKEQQENQGNPSVN